MIAVVDYGCGNIFSLKQSLSYIGADCVVTGDKDIICSCERIILPGVGAFGAAADKLRETGLGELIRSQALSGKPLLGICLGMQLLVDSSCEFGFHEGLGLIPGKIVPIADTAKGNLKIPHMGWNCLTFPQQCRLFSGIPQGSFVYFVHSYCAVDCDESVVAVTDYGGPVTAAIARDNIYGVQFHPEKSGGVGLDILRSFCMA